VGRACSPSRCDLKRRVADGLRPPWKPPSWRSFTARAMTLNLERHISDHHC